jgi:hypothetical protein
MAFSLLGTPATGFNAAAGTSIASSSVAHTAGKLIVVSVGWETTLVTVTVTDSAGNVYLPLTTRSHGGVSQFAKQFYTLISKNHPTNIITANYSGSVDFRSIHVSQWNYVGPIAFDTEDFAEVTGGTSLSLTVTPTNSVYGSNLIALVTKSFAPTTHTNTVGGFTDGPESDVDMQQWYQVRTAREIIPTTFTFAADDVLINWATFRETNVLPMMGQACLV